MATEDREKMESRGAGESCPHFPKPLQGEPVPEGKPRASVEAESLKPGSSYDHLEEMEICEDGGCPGQPKAGPTTKGQAGDGPEAVELAPVPAPAPGVESKAEVELEKMRMEFELTRLKYLHAENERQRQHQQAMERLQQQVAVHQFQGGLQDLLLPQNQFVMFLYCFIFIHTIYVTKEMVFFLFSKHYLFCIAAILLCLIKTLWSYFQLSLFSLPWEPPCQWYWGTTQTSPSPPSSCTLYLPSVRTCCQRGLCCQPMTAECEETRAGPL